MSIRGIDTQIMITAAQETVKDTSALLKHASITHDHTVLRTNEESELDRSRVIATNENEMENVRTDVEGEGSGAGGGGGGRKKEEEDEEEVTPELMVAPPAHEQIIDITI